VSPAQAFEFIIQILSSTRGEHRRRSHGEKGRETGPPVEHIFALSLGEKTEGAKLGLAPQVKTEARVGYRLAGL